MEKKAATLYVTAYFKLVKLKIYEIQSAPACNATLLSLPCSLPFPSANGFGSASTYFLVESDALPPFGFTLPTLLWPGCVKPVSLAFTKACPKSSA